MVRFGVRVPSIRKRISARTSLKRYVRNSLGLKAPRGWGWLTNPRKAAYNRVYNRTTRGCLVVLGLWGAVLSAVMAFALSNHRKFFRLHESFRLEFRGKSGREQAYGTRPSPIQRRSRRQNPSAAR